MQIIGTLNFQIAKEYLKVQTELAYVAQKRQELQEEASHCESLLPKIDEQEDVKKLREEKVSITVLRACLSHTHTFVVLNFI